MNNSPPEIERLRSKIMLRSGGLLAVATLVAALVAQRLGAPIDVMHSTIGTVLLACGLAGLVTVAFNRDSYLPFLGEAAFPPSVLAVAAPSDAAFTVNVTVPVGATHVVYWASESGAGVAPSPWDAYGNYKNAGVVVAGSTGAATLAVRCPGQYRVRGNALPRHVHYRGVYPSGILGAVQTKEIECL